MDDAREFGRGAFIGEGGGATLVTSGGVFIPYDTVWGGRMRALYAFLTAHYDRAEERFPAMFEERMWADEKIAHIRRQKACVTIPARQEEGCFREPGEAQNPFQMLLGKCLLEWMKQDIGQDDTPEFWSMYHARCRHLGRLARAIFQGKNDER